MAIFGALLAKMKRSEGTARFHNFAKCLLSQKPGAEEEGKASGIPEELEATIPCRYRGCAATVTVAAAR
jgi:hypothetical protein